MELTHGVMLDVKAWDEQIYRKLTNGPTISVVQKNIGYLMASNKLEEIRIVCLPGEVDVEAVISGVAKTIGGKVSSVRLKLIKFRHFGVKGRLQSHSSLNDTYMQKLKQLAIGLGFEKTVVV